MSAADSTPAPPTPALPPRNRYGWIVFFVFVFTASIGVMAFMIWFNLSIQLKPEQLADARKLWQEKNVQDYDMVYTEKHSPDDKTTTFRVKVRGGKVQEVLMNGRPLEKDKEVERKDDPRIYHSMDALLRYIDRNLEMDAKAGAKNFVTAKFDPATGRLRNYVRRVMRSQERVEVDVKEFVCH